MIVMPVVAVPMIVVRRMRVSRAVPMVIMTVGVIHLVAAWIARMRAKQRHRASNERADQRQKNDSLNHGMLLLRRMIWSENRCPFFGIMH